jgi:hypothetical protein
MSIKLVGDYPNVYIFPLAQNQLVPEVGFGFDLVKGAPIGLQALTVTQSSLIAPSEPYIVSAAA